MSVYKNEFADRQVRKFQFVKVTLMFMKIAVVVAALVLLAQAKII